MRMFSEQKKFNYVPPKMTYDKETGDVTIHEQKDDEGSKRKIITSVDEAKKVRQELFDELNLDEDGMPRDTPTENVDIDAHAQKVKKLRQGFIDDYDIDPNLQHVFSRDFMRVDVGLMIQRPPIFVRMRSNDIDFLTARQKLMEEYSVDTK